MNGRVVGVLAAVGTGIAVTVFSAWAGPTALDRVTKAYEGIRDVSGAFVQTSEMPELDRTEEARGSFRAILPDHLRWDYDSPRKQAAELKGPRVRILQAGSDEVMEGVVDEEKYGAAPMALLMGPAVFLEDFVVTEPEPQVLELRPKASVPGMRVVRLFLSDSPGFPLLRLQVEDSFGNTNTFVFSGVEINRGLRAEDLRLPEVLP